jgi:hypothetical protein
MRLSRLGPINVVFPHPREAGMYETLSERVDKLIGRPHKRPLLSSTGDHAAIRELISRIEGLEKAVREIAREFQELAARPREA